MDHLYEEAAKIHQKVLSKSESLKSLVFGSTVRNKKALYALVCESLKCSTLLADIKEHCGSLKQDKFFIKNEHLCNVLLYEHVLGKGVKGKYAGFLRKHKVSINTQTELMKIRSGVTNLKQLAATNETDYHGSALPKYVRINTLKATKDRVYKQMEADGYTHTVCDSDSFADVVSGLEKKNFTTDPHIPDLLVFPPSTDFHDNPLYTSGKIILQDKASCVPAYILSPPQGTSVIDCCAAPGNKTSHMASIMANKGTVYAFDKSKNRLATLKKQMEKAGASCVRADHKDFLTVNPADAMYRNVEYILVDPSCSGSGMINRVTQHTDESDSASEGRLAQLSKFQISILKHALSFPRVRKVVYSTCSIHEQENEGVVQEVLSKYTEYFQLKRIMPDWPHRGLSSYDIGSDCIRMTHDNALTNGFFVACFERRPGSEMENPMEQDVVSEDNAIDEHDCSKDESDADNINLDIGQNGNSSVQGKEGNRNASKKKKKKRKKNKLFSNDTEMIGSNLQHSKGKGKDRDEVSNSDSVQIVEKKANACKKKRKKNKEHTVDTENITSMNENGFISKLGKRKLTDSFTDNAEKKANACKKKRKKSKDRKMDTDNVSRLSTVDQVVQEPKHDRDVIDSNPKKTNACKKKRKKNKEHKIKQ